MRFKKYILKYMSNQDKEIKELKKIIEEQNKVIELLKNRLIELANDVDREHESKRSYYTLCLSPYRRTENWEW